MNSQHPRTELHIAHTRQELNAVLQQLVDRLQAGNQDFICYTGEPDSFLLELKCIPFHLRRNENIYPEN
ncbi:hypothetical protein MKQ70_21585 [Chitinophaga sedimenti]|uniref:hypothetical protein n=1 Tax=Chitinophaga sedimenti TaxID=2033606 RepID=UPI002002C091|nr:hypothetical protein [Chitinophaga sedimenti]MCK7557457.1 hypothetical protein [Chitinophaga sedimenti]